MTIKERIQSIAKKLDFIDKIKSQSLTADDWLAMAKSYKSEFKTNLQEDLEAEMSLKNVPAISQEQLNGIQSGLLGILNVLGTGATPTAGEGTPAAVPAANADVPSVIIGGGAPTPTAGEGVPASVPAANADGTPANGGVTAATPESISQLTQQIGNMFNHLGNKPAADLPLAQVISSPLSAMGTGTTANHLFGIESSYFDMNKRWNKVANNPREALSMEDPDETIEAAFKNDVVSFSKSLKQRYAYLHTNNMLDIQKLNAGAFGTNYDGLADAKVGDQYVVLRQDALIARILLLRDVTQFFPLRYGIQDHDLIFNSFFTELSQAYQKGEIWKGSSTIEPEMGYVDDAMIKMQFGPMKELERKYIGYLNKEGSDPIKWNMIEFNILNSLQTAQVEQNKRRIRGIYVKPEEGKPGSYLTSSTGLVYTLLRYVHENKILLHDDDAYRSYVKATMLESAQAFVSDVDASVSEDVELDNYSLYLNKRHKTWWIENVREKYGKDLDFQGPNSYLNVVPDTDIKIIWLPYQGQSTLMFMQVPGNIQFLENVPGEMLGIKMTERMEEVNAWSTWKEGTSASFVGRKFANKAALVANSYEWQQIFMNKPAFTLAADVTAVDATNGFWQITVNNTAAKALTDITGAKAGVAYKIECGGLTNATTIAKSGKFATITSAYTPTALEDYILVILNSEKTSFLELERQVAGVRTINPLLQPNIPGVR